MKNCRLKTLLPITTKKTVKDQIISRVVTETKESFTLTRDNLEVLVCDALGLDGSQIQFKWNISRYLDVEIIITTTTEDDDHF